MNWFLAWHFFWTTRKEKKQWQKKPKKNKTTTKKTEWMKNQKPTFSYFPVFVIYSKKGVSLTCLYWWGHCGIVLQVKRQNWCQRIGGKGLGQLGRCSCEATGDNSSSLLCPVRCNSSMPIIDPNFIHSRCIQWVHSLFLLHGFQNHIVPEFFSLGKIFSGHWIIL